MSNAQPKPKLCSWQDYDQAHYFYRYPLEVPPRPANPVQLPIDDLERIARYRRGYGGALSDALFQKGIVGTVLSHDLKPLRADDLLVGRALPVKWHSVAPETTLTAEQVAARAARWEAEGSPQKLMHAAVFPGCVMVFDTGSDLHAAQFGEMSCTLARSHGCVGVVNNGMTRDSRYIKMMKDFAYFTRGTTPNSYGMGRPIEVNVPVWIPGHLQHYVPVFPGDFLFGDSDGLQVIPRDYVDEVLLKVEEILDFEDREREQIEEGMPLDQVYAEFGDL